MRPLRRLSVVSALSVIVGLLAGAGVGVGAASASTLPQVTYTATVNIPIPPASNFAGLGGGDGWAVALSPTAQYNVFHHDTALQVACHLQVDASNCWTTDPKTITQPNGANPDFTFASSGQPGMWLDQANGHLYVYATRDDSTAGVVCIDTTQPAANLNPFCGFTALSAVGAAPTNIGGWSAISDPVFEGSGWYAFNYVDGVGVSGTQNKLMCFSTVTLTACAGQPFSVPLGTGTVSISAPSPSIANIANEVIVPVNTTTNTSGELACFNASTHAGCAGSWPVVLTNSYPGNYGEAFPLLSPAGAVAGVCLPAPSDPCYSPSGAVAATPANLATVVTPNNNWNGGALVLGPRVYLPYFGSSVVACYDFSTHASCVNFPKQLTNLSLLYTVNPDPQRPTCIWVNADNGGAQIQNFDAFTGGACGAGAIRVVASSVIPPNPLCVPGGWTSLQVLTPARSSYASGTVQFQDADANPLQGISAKALDQTGSVDLTGLNLNSGIGLPQFLITLTGETGSPGEVQVKLTWTGQFDQSCLVQGAHASELLTNGVAMLGGDGGLFTFGRPFVGAANFGGLPGPLTTPNGHVISTTFTGLAPTQDRNGYWAVLGTGEVFPLGNAHNYGGTAGQALNGRIVGIAATRTGHGYWLVGSDGGIFTFGDAHYFGSMGGTHLNGSIVGIAATPTGNGYWLVGSDGGLFTFGDAHYFGSMGSKALNAPIVGLAASPTGNGYWLAARDGGVFTFGDSRFFGSMGSTPLNAGVVAVAPTSDGRGYWLVGADGGMFTFGDAPYLGSLAGTALRAPIVSAVS